MGGAAPEAGGVTSMGSPVDWLEGGTEEARTGILRVLPGASIAVRISGLLDGGSARPLISRGGTRGGRGGKEEQEQEEEEGGREGGGERKKRRRREKKRNEERGGRGGSRSRRREEREKKARQRQTDEKSRRRDSRKVKKKYLIPFLPFTFLSLKEVGQDRVSSG